MLYNKAIAAAASAPALKTYVEDVFSTYLYTGNGSTQTITNGIDLSGEGGLVWNKSRSLSGGSGWHFLYDTARGVDSLIASNSTTPYTITSDRPISSFNSNGFTTDYNTSWVSNNNGSTYASWTFRKAEKFFDVVTYTGDGIQGRQIAHNLGSTPGVILVKMTAAVNFNQSWYVWHRSVNGGSAWGTLNSTAAFRTDLVPLIWGDGTNYVAPTSTNFTVGLSEGVNESGATYVAYLFAHDAGGFGDSGNENVISCGSYTGNGSSISGPAINLGWEPQWLLIKRASGGTGTWLLLDSMRGITTGGTEPFLAPNLADPENVFNDLLSLTPTGFAITSNLAGINDSGNNYIYIAIRRGPMKTPTDATEVLSAGLYSVNNTNNRLVTTGILTDAVFVKQRNSTAQATVVGDRLRGQPYLVTSTTAAEVNVGDGFDQQLVGGVQYGSAFSSMNGFWVGANSTARLNSGFETNQHIAWAFRRAPGFFDVVAFRGTGSATTVNHNLTVAPELMITKRRAAVENWQIYSQSTGASAYLTFTATAAVTGNTNRWNATDPTSSVFSISTAFIAQEYIAYLFATCPGVSKVGSYTGTGTTLNIDCGFTNGARFVLIKRTDSTGDWYVWDTARGIIAANDPYLLLNSIGIEVTNTDYIDPLSTGFQISSTAPAAINASGGSFIFLAIA